MTDEQAITSHVETPLQIAARRYVDAPGQFVEGGKGRIRMACDVCVSTDSPMFDVCVGAPCLTWSGAIQSLVDRVAADTRILWDEMEALLVREQRYCSWRMERS